MLCCKSDPASASCKLVNMSRVGRPGSYLYEVLSSMVQNNIEYFRYIDTEVGNKILTQLKLMQDLLQSIESSAYKIVSTAHLYDFDDVPANGFRSFITVVDRFILVATRLNRGLCIKRDSVFFGPKSCLNELENHVDVLRGLRIAVSLLEQMMTHTDTGNLFVNNSMSFNDLFKECDNFDPTSFYGRCMGFYYCDAIRRTLRKGHAVLSAYRDHYYQAGRGFSNTTSLLWSFGKYSMDSELRAKQMVEMRKNVHTDFLKAMWSLNEQAIFKKVNRFVSSSLPVCSDVTIPLEPLSLPKAHDPSITVEIPFPNSHAPSAPLHCRLLSAAVRDGMQSLLPSNVVNSNNVLPPSHGLILHFHGGGFIAQSAESHEIYLKDWAKLVHVPILSVDYSLAPECPFPRALEEVTFAYAWVLNNASKLGWTGERICVAGDSAGGNLTLALCIRMIQLGLRRPDTIFCAYTPVMLNARPSPSKVLTCVDPLIPMEFLLTCVHAYVGVGSPHTKNEEECGKSVGNQESFIQSAVSCSGTEGKAEVNNPEETARNSIPEMGDSSNFTETQSQQPSIYTPSTASLELNSPVKNADTKDATGSISNATDHENGEEHIIFEIPLDLSASVKQKAAEMTKQSLGKMSTPTRRKPTKTRRDEIPWFHANHPDRLRILEDLVERATDPLMTPYLASEDLLRKMPPTYLLCLHLDPALDDMVMLAKKLQSLGVSVSVKVLDFLPHGFLNLFPRGNEAQEGILCCANMLRQALDMDSPGCK